MKAKIFFLGIFLTFILGNANAQVAINDDGSTADASAMLDIQSNDKGIMIPRVTLTSLDNFSPIEGSSATATGLLVYNLGSEDVDEGFYYWSSNKWKQITNSESNVSINQLSGLYEAAELYEDTDFNDPVSISLTNANQPYGWVSATAGETFGDTEVNTLPNNSATGGDQIIIGEAGLYQVTVSASFAGTNNFQVTGAVWNDPISGDPTYETRVRFLVKLKAFGDLEGSSAQGLLNLAEGDILDLRFTSTTAGETLELYNISFIVNKVAD